MSHPTSGVDAAVAGWARTTPADIPSDLLDTLAVAATGGGLDADELAEVLGLGRDVAIGLIDDARATALVTDDDILLEAAMAPLRARIGRRPALVGTRTGRTHLGAGAARAGGGHRGRGRGHRTERFRVGLGYRPTGR